MGYDRGEEGGVGWVGVLLWSKLHVYIAQGTTFFVNNHALSVLHVLYVMIPCGSLKIVFIVTAHTQHTLTHTHTHTGVLIVSVRWRNRHFSGSLIDTGHHEWAPPR